MAVGASSTAAAQTATDSPPLQDVPIPTFPTHFVTDPSHFLSARGTVSLEALLEHTFARTHRRFYAYVAPTIGYNSASLWMLRTLASWHVSHPEIDDGAILFVVVDERGVRFEVGNTLARYVPEAVCSQIVRNSVLPALRDDAPDTAVTAGLEQLVRAVKGLSLDPPDTSYLPQATGAWRDYNYARASPAPHVATQERRLDRYVDDGAKLLQKKTVDALRDRLRSFQERSGYIVRVVTVSSRGAQSPEAYAAARVAAWERERKDASVILAAFFFAHERDAVMVTGSKLTNVLSPANADRLVRNDVRPAISTNRYNTAATNAANDLVHELAPDEPSFADTSTPNENVFVGLMLALWYVWLHADAFGKFFGVAFPSMVLFVTLAIVSNIVGSVRRRMRKG